MQMRRRSLFTGAIGLPYVWPQRATARRALTGLLDAVPFAKIMGFGGDYRYVELSYGHSRIARANIARVLAELVEGRTLQESEAAGIAEAILVKHPSRLFPRNG